MGTYLVYANPTTNRLYIFLFGSLTNTQAKAAASAVIAAVQRLKPGFDAITDISTFQPVSLQATVEMARAQQAVKAGGVRRVVRIQPTPTPGGVQLQRYGAEAGYEADIVETREAGNQYCIPRAAYVRVYQEAAEPSFQHSEG